MADILVKGAAGRKEGKEAASASRREELEQACLLSHHTHLLGHPTLRVHTSSENKALPSIPLFQARPTKMAYQFKKGCYGYTTGKDTAEHTAVNIIDPVLQKDIQCESG